MQEARSRGWAFFRKDLVADSPVAMVICEFSPVPSPGNLQPPSRMNRTKGKRKPLPGPLDTRSFSFKWLSVLTHAVKGPTHGRCLQ